MRHPIHVLLVPIVSAVLALAACGPALPHHTFRALDTPPSADQLLEALAHPADAPEVARLMARLGPPSERPDGGWLGTWRWADLGLSLTFEQPFFVDDPILLELEMQGGYRHEFPYGMDPTAGSAAFIKAHGEPKDEQRTETGRLFHDTLRGGLQAFSSFPDNPSAPGSVRWTRRPAVGPTGEPPPMADLIDLLGLPLDSPPVQAALGNLGAPFIWPMKLNDLSWPTMGALHLVFLETEGEPATHILVRVSAKAHYPGGNQVDAAWWAEREGLLERRDVTRTFAVYSWPHPDPRDRAVPRLAEEARHRAEKESRSAAEQARLAAKSEARRKAREEEGREAARIRALGPFGGRPHKCASGDCKAGDGVVDIERFGRLRARFRDGWPVLSKVTIDYERPGDRPSRYVGGVDDQLRPHGADSRLEWNFPTGVEVYAEGSWRDGRPVWTHRLHVCHPCGNRVTTTYDQKGNLQRGRDLYGDETLIPELRKWWVQEKAQRQKDSAWRAREAERRAKEEQERSRREAHARHVRERRLLALDARIAELKGQVATHGHTIVKHTRYADAGIHAKAHLTAMVDSDRKYILVILGDGVLASAKVEYWPGGPFSVQGVVTERSCTAAKGQTCTIKIHTAGMAAKAASVQQVHFDITPYPVGSAGVVSVDSVLVDVGAM